MPDVADHPRVVAVVATVGGEVEGHRQALLAGREVAPVEGVRLVGRGEPGVLADRPRLVDVHRGIGATDVRRDAGIRLDGVEALDRRLVVEDRHLDALGRVPGELGGVVAGLGADGVGPLLDRAGRFGLAEVDR
jgi:hypothetical protein